MDQLREHRQRRQRLKFRPNLRFADFPSDYATLPTVAFVIPNLNHDMHNGKPGQSIPPRDAWLRANLGGYYQWAQTHNSLLIAAFIVTFDENDAKDSILAHHRSDAWAAKVGRHSSQILPEQASPTRQSSQVFSSHSLSPPATPIITLFVCRLVALEERRLDEPATALRGRLQAMQAGYEPMSISGTQGIDPEFLAGIPSII